MGSDSSHKPLIAVIFDRHSPNGKGLLELLPQVEDKVSCIIGNSLADLSCQNLEEVEVIVLVVFAAGNPAVIADIWSSCPKLKWVHSMAAGVDTLVPVMNNLPGGPEMPLTNAKGAFSRSLGEYCIAAMMHFNKQIPRLQSNKDGKIWDKFIMGELHGLTVGFIGFGDIAQTTARLCKAFGMRVMALRNTRGLPGNDLADVVCYASDAKDGTAKEEVFRHSDFVICSLPGGSGTYHACGAAEFMVMKPSSVFVSIGRGSCVDEAALVETLQQKKIAGAALDVFETEPLPAKSPLWELDNVLLSPHNADLTSTYMKMTFDVFMEKITTFTSSGVSGFDAMVDKKKGY